MESEATIQRCCPLCGSADTAAYLQKGDLTLGRCQRCAMIFATPVAAEMGGGYYDRLGRPYYLSPEKLESDYASVRFKRELRLFRRYCQSGAVLDVGCSTGAFLFHLKSNGNYEATGADVSRPALEYARNRGLTIFEEDFLTHDFGDIQFSAVTFWAVIEHLLEPVRFLEKARAVLAESGLCFVLVPNMRSLAVRLLGAKYRYLFPQHVNYFAPKTLRALARRTRFQVLELGSMHFNPLVIWQDLCGRGEFVPDAERAALAKRTTAYKKSALLGPVKFTYHLVEKCLGTLFLADNVYAVLQRN